MSTVVPTTWRQLLFSSATRLNTQRTSIYFVAIMKRLSPTQYMAFNKKLQGVMAIIERI